MTVSTCSLFSSRETLEEAIEYSTELIGSLPREHQMTAMTALWVSVNTALLQIEKAKQPPLSSIKPQTDEEAAKEPPYTIDTISSERAAQLVRNELHYAIVTGWKISEFFPRAGEQLTTYLLLVGRLYGLDDKDIVAEVEKLLAREKGGL